MSTDYLFSAYNKVKKHLKKFLIVEGFILGVFSGIIAILYRLSLSFAERLLNTILIYIEIHPYAIVLWFLFIGTIAFFIGRLIHYEPQIAFSGIAEVLEELNHNLNASWLKVTCLKMISGFLCILCGLSLGRAGPSIQLGAMGAKGISKLFRRYGNDETTLIACGSSAGLSAAFNAPLTSIFFVFEGLKRRLSPRLLVPLVLSAFTAFFTTKYLFGLNSVFHFSVEHSFTIIYYLPILILGILTGLLGRFHNKVLEILLNLFHKIFKLNFKYRLIVPFVTAFILALLLPSVLGSGYFLILSLTADHLALTAILMLLLIKFLFSMICMSSGAPGGTFFPILVIGSLIGAVYGTVLIQQFGIDINFLNSFIIFAMAGYFSAVNRTPLTAFFFIAELTGNYDILIPLFLVSIISYGTLLLLNHVPFKKQNAIE